MWHGLGATPEERQAALEYARSLASDPEAVIELTEGHGDEDEMFWLILGEGEYAKADYWKWKPSIPSLGVKSWLVDTNGVQKNVSHYCRISYGFSDDTSQLVRRASIEAEGDAQDHVYLLDCVLEYYVLVGSEARDKRRDIRLALHLANVSPSRVFCGHTC